MTSLTARLAAAALAVPLVIATAGTASAGSKWTYKSSGSFASASWMEVGEIEGVGGNYHVGYLEARGDRSIEVWGEVVDWTCEDGATPPDGGGHGEEPPESECEWESSRWIGADPSAVTLTVDRKLNSARLVGRLFVSDHDAAVNPPVDMTWTGIGTISKSTNTYSYTDSDGSKWSDRTTETSREGDISGRIGGMVFDDEAGEFSNGYFGTYRTDSRQTTP